MRGEDICAANLDAYRQLFSDCDRLFLGKDSAPRNVVLEGRRDAPFDAKLYSQPSLLSHTPIQRFLAETPMESAHPWLATNASSDESGVLDAEKRDMQRLASEMMSVDEALDLPEEGDTGSARASSDAYPLARRGDWARERMEQRGGARSWRVVRMRRRGKAGDARRARS